MKVATIVLLNHHCKSRDMKKIVLSFAILGIVSFANAQTNSERSVSDTVHSSTTDNIKTTKKEKTTNNNGGKLNNRKIFKSKKNGQAASTTGQQATGTNGSHANMPKNANRKRTRE